MTHTHKSFNIQMFALMFQRALLLILWINTNVQRVRPLYNADTPEILTWGAKHRPDRFEEKVQHQFLIDEK